MTQSQITNATLVDDHRETGRVVIEVTGKGARGGAFEWTVHYNRHGNISHGFRLKGPGTGEGYTPPHLIPPEVKDAANKLYSARGVD